MKSFGEDMDAVFATFALLPEKYEAVHISRAQAILLISLPYYHIIQIIKGLEFLVSVW
jgi:hypothetical protein